jgi:hypothetical protein
MWSKIKQLSWRILFIPVSGLFVLQLFSLFGRALNDLFYFLTADTDYHFFLRYDARDKIILWSSLFWVISLLTFEIIAVFSANFRFRRLLTNLRFAPLMILFISTVIVIFFDLGMIEYSKWRIRNYVFSDSNVIVKPDFRPHVDYRGWCGNGYSARESDLYFDVATEGITDENPKVRARAFLMTLEVRDFLNGGDRGNFEDVLRKTCRDTEFEVRNLAENYLGEDSSCQKFLSVN